MKFEPQQHTGKLVALEGDVDTVATQLQLLPPSQKILILPHLLDNLPRHTEAQSFNARAFIQDVHTSFIERAARARSFLQSSTPAQPRLVFMNGGSVGARATCITRICENITNGEIREAEIIFNEIVKDGVAGLMKPEEVIEEEIEADEPEPVEEEQPVNVEERQEDPTVKAMKAADSLDRETAELQEDSIEDSAVDLKTPTGPEVGSEAQEVPKAQDDVLTSSIGGDIVRTVVTVPNRAERTQKRNTFVPGSPGYKAKTPTTFTPTTPYTAALSPQTEHGYDYDCDDDYDPDLVSQGDDSFFSVPPTPRVVYGEACVVDVAAVTPEKAARKVKSFDKFFPSRSGSSDWIPTSPTQVRHSKSAYHLGRAVTSGGVIQKDENFSRFQTLPRTTFMKASTTLIKKSSTSGESRSSSISTPQITVYVERGCDAGEIFVEEVDANEPEEIPPFEPVFDVVEDLVIHFSHDTPNDIFEYVMSAYKNGSYPILPSTPKSNSVSEASPKSLNGEEPTMRPTSHLTAETDDDGFHRRHEFDPYADNNYPGGVNQWRLENKSSRSTSGRNLEPPTPSLTPPPTARGISEKFCEFSPMNPNSVIGIQNSLRSLLKLHFPAGENGYTQHYFPVSPETDRLWKPVFRNDENASIGNEGRTVDQIIALGCEEGVKKDFFAQVSGQIEKLGMKRDGLNRSSKIDLRYVKVSNPGIIANKYRYFIGNIVQTHSHLPLSLQSTFNPFSSPEATAACIVPQLEAYLATNNSVRLLILHYSSNHLAIIMALRKILGQDVLKIAGIMDSLSSDPPSIVSHPRTPTTNPLSNDATSTHKRAPQAHARESSQRRNSISSHISTLNTASNHSLKKSESGVSFSKANYLLPSAATDAEITAFLSGIWTSLMEKSAFYTPEPEPKPIIVEKPALPPTPTTTTRETTHPPISYRNGPNRESKIARLTGNPGASSTPPRTPTGSKGHKYAASLASTVRTTNSERVRREEARIEKDWENFYIGDEDSEDDDYDRMVMGRALAKIVPEVRMTVEGKQPKRSTKKALKWLGLA